MVGDIIFFNSGNLISKIISKLTKSDLTHVGLIIAEIKDSDILIIIESEKKSVAKINYLKMDWDKHSIYRLKNKDKFNVDEIVRQAYSKMGTKYDYFKILGMFISLITNKRRYRIFNSSKRMICSELIDISYYSAGVRRLNDIYIGNVTPSELLMVYDFEKVNKK